MTDDSNEAIVKKGKIAKPMDPWWQGVIYGVTGGVVLSAYYWAESKFFKKKPPTQLEKLEKNLSKGIVTGGLFGLGHLIGVNEETQFTVSQGNIRMRKEIDELKQAIAPQSDSYTNRIEAEQESCSCSKGR